MKLTEAEQMFDLFVAGGITCAEFSAIMGIAEQGQTGIDIMTWQIQDMRQNEPDDLPYTDREIAEGIMRYCQVEIAIAEGSNHGA